MNDDTTRTDFPIDMAGKYETSIYTQEQLDSARDRSRVVGWIQGGLSVLGAILLLKMLGWIPLLVLLAVAGYGGYRLFTKGRQSGF